MELIEKQEAIRALKVIRNGLWEIDIPQPGNCPEYVEHHRQISVMIGNVDGWIKRLMDMPTLTESLTDAEQRIFLAAMAREEMVCGKIDRSCAEEPYKVSLMSVCQEIKRKVKSALWA